MKRESVLTWTSESGALSIESNALRLDSRTGRGATDLSPGPYRGFVVQGEGHWTITIRPR